MSGKASRKLIDAGVQPDQGYYYVGTATTLQTIVAPASNTKGIVVSYAYVRIIGNNLVGRVMAKASAPASVHDTTALSLAHGDALNYTNKNSAGYTHFLPPGVGLYAQKEDANAVSGFSVNYKVLS